MKAIENKEIKKLDAIEKNNRLKDDKAKNNMLLKYGLKKLIKSYRGRFSTFVRSELKQLATSEENIDKKLLQEIFFDGFSFLKKYDTPNMFLKNFVANKRSIKTENNDQRDFVFNLMKGYNVNSSLKKSGIKDLDNRNLYEKSKRKALDILLECEKSTEGIKKVFFQKTLKNT